MRRLHVAVGATVLLWGVSAHADNKAQCFNAASQGQTLRDAHKLVEARAQFLICARQVCPAQVQKDCMGWLNGVEQNMPTVVMSAKDQSGHDIFDVSVTVDGRPVASKLEGDAIPLDPGAHTFEFRTAAGATLKRQLIVREGVKNQNVAVVLGPAPGSAPAASPQKGAAHASPKQATKPAPSASEQSAPGSPAKHGSPWRTVGFVAGGAGVIGLGVGVAFGFMAMSDKKNAHCDSSNACDPGPLANAKSAANISTIGVVAGGVLLAGGAALVLFGPHGKPQERRALRIAPMVGGGVAGLTLERGW